MSQQIARHTAVVLAGMASIGFTVAAGTYIVNQMASDPRDHAPHPVPGAVAPQPPTVERAAAPDLPAATVSLAAEARVYPAVVPGQRPASVAAAPPAAPTVVGVRAQPGTRLPLLGDAYVGTKLIRTEPDSLSMTVDTNLLAALTCRSVAPETQLDDTLVRTDLDVERGEITLAVSDPALGDHAVRLSQQHHDPASAAPEALLDYA